MIRSDVKRVSVSALCYNEFANRGRSIRFETVGRAIARIRPMRVTVVSFLARNAFLRDRAISCRVDIRWKSSKKETEELKPGNARALAFGRDLPQMSVEKR